MLKDNCWRLHSQNLFNQHTWEAGKEWEWDCPVDKMMCFSWLHCRRTPAKTVRVLGIRCDWGCSAEMFAEWRNSVYALSSHLFPSLPPSLSVSMCLCLPPSPLRVCVSVCLSVWIWHHPMDLNFTCNIGAFLEWVFLSSLFGCSLVLTALKN